MNLVVGESMNITIAFSLSTSVLLISFVYLFDHDLAM